MMNIKLAVVVFLALLVVLVSAYVGHWWSKERVAEMVVSDIILDASDLIARAKAHGKFSEEERTLFIARASLWNRSLTMLDGHHSSKGIAAMCARLKELDEISSAYSTALADGFEFNMLSVSCPSVQVGYLPGAGASAP